MKLKINDLKEYVQSHAILFSSFDFDKNGCIDYQELNFIYKLVEEYSGLTICDWELCREIDNNSVIETVKYSSINFQSPKYGRPVGKKQWIPLSVFTIEGPIETVLDDDSIIIVSTDTISGYEIVQHKGLVWGVAVRSKDYVTDIFAGFKNIFGGEVKGYTDLAIETKQSAMDRMTVNAKRLGANAIIGMRMDTGGAGYGLSEVTAYGTAVRIKKTT